MRAVNCRVVPKPPVEHNYRMYVLLSFLVLAASIVLLIPPRQPETTGFVVIQNGQETCACQGVSTITVVTNVTLNCSSTYNLSVKIFQGGNANPKRVIDSENIVFTGCPQGPVDNNPGGNNGNLIIESIGADNVTLRFYNTTLNKLRADDTFLVTINASPSIQRGPSTKHLSCSQPIDVGETFGDFTIIALNKLLKGTNCTFLAVVQTDKPVYKFGEAVNITGYNWDSSAFITCNMTMPNSTVFEFNATSDALGRFNHTYTLSFTHPIGIYSVYCIEPSNPAKNDSTTFEVDQKPVVFTDKESYGFNETVNITCMDLIPNGSAVLWVKDVFGNYAPGFPTVLPTGPNGTANTTFFSNQFCPDTYTVVCTDQVNPFLQANTTFTITAGDGSLALNASSDTYIWESSQTTNYGGDNELRVRMPVDDRKNTLVRFNITLPLNTTITGAALALLQVDGAGGSLNITAYRALKPWTEYGATWRKYNASHNWTAKGGDYSNNSGWLSVNNNLTIRLWPVLDIVTGWMQGWPNYGFVLSAANTSTAIRMKAFDSRNASGGTPPLLLINYTSNASCTYFPSTNDTQPPNVTQLAPANNSNVNQSGSFATVNFTFVVDDFLSSIDNCTLVLDGANVSVMYSVFEGVNQTFVRNVTAGNHSWQVKCYDSAGNIGSGPLLYFGVDLSPPSVLNVTVFPPVINATGSVNITAVVTDDELVLDVSVNITYPDGSSVVALMVQSGNVWVYEFTANLSLSDGAYNATIIATDIKGKGNASESAKFIVTPPGGVTVTLLSPPNGTVTGSDTILFSYYVQGNASTYNCTLFNDGTPVATNASVANATTVVNTVSNISFGQHDWHVSCLYQGVNVANSTKRTFTITPPPVSAVLAGMLFCTVSADVAEAGDDIIFQADITLGTQLPSQANMTVVNISVLRIENVSRIVVLNATAMHFLEDGIWYYQYNIGDDAPGTYISIFTAITNQSPPQTLRCTTTHTVGGRGNLAINGISPDFINLNETTRLAAEVRVNGVPVNASLIKNATLVVILINQSTSTYTTTNGLQVGDGIMYLDGSFNTSGVYQLNWSLTYYNISKSAQEIVVVSGIENKLLNLNISVPASLLTTILEVRTILLEVLKDLERLQQFSEEEVFLITDSVNSLNSIVEQVEDGSLSADQAQSRFNEIQQQISAKLGTKLTGLAGAAQVQTPGSTTPVVTPELETGDAAEKRIVQGIVILLIALLIAVVVRATWRYLSTPKDRQA